MCSDDYGELLFKKISICEVRPLIKNTALGTSFYDLKRGLKRLGISSVISQAIEQKEVFDQISYPCITQLVNEQGIHFVVLFERRGTNIIVGDSSGDREQKISIKKFMKNWIPYILEIDVVNSSIVYEIEQRTKEVSMFKILNLVKLELIISFIVSIIIYISGILIANLYTLYFNLLIPQKLGSLAIDLMLAYLLINLINFVLSFSNNFIYNLMCKKIDKRIIEKYFIGLLEKPNMAIESYEIGELLTNLSNVLMIRQRFLTYLQMIPVSIVTMVFSIYILFNAESKLAIFVIILVIVLGVVLYVSKDYYEKLSKNLIKRSQEFNDSVINIFSNMSIIKQLSLEKEFGSRGTKKLTDFISMRTKLFNFDSMQSQLKSFILSSFNIILFSSGVYLIIQGQLSSGVLLTFNAILAYVTNPILNLANLQSVLVQGRVAQDKLYNILESKIRFFGNETLNLSRNNIEINFEKVDFDYDSSSQVFTDLSMSITGNNIAISGVNGVGKSTFGKIISRLYIPDQGKILINNQDIMKVSNESISQNIIYVDGRENLFSSTVLDNIKLGRNIEDKEIFETLETLNSSTIFPNIDFEGINNDQLSLGQMQIIKILRSTLIKKNIYIFDEITNGLDSSIKKSVVDYLLNLEGLKLFITHDKEVIECCEQELEIKDKKVVRRR